MKKSILTSLLLIFSVGATHAEWFRHRSTTDNSRDNYTLLARHLTSARTDLFFFQRLQRGSSSVHPNLSLGLWFPADRQRWSIFNEKNTEAMGVGLEYAVYRAEENDSSFIHRHRHADQGAFSSRSFLDHPALNGRADAFPFIAQNWDASGGIYRDQFISMVSYDEERQQWYILVQDVDTFNEFPMIPDGAAWNVLIKAPSERTFRVVTTTINEAIVLDHPLLNNNRHALFLLSMEFQLRKSFNGRLTAIYDETLNRWMILKISGTNFVAGLNLLVTLVEGSDVDVPSIHVEHQSPQNLLQFPTEFGFRYQLESSVNLTNWFSDGLSFSGNGEFLSYPANALAPRAFYRLKRAYE